MQSFGESYDIKYHIFSVLLRSGSKMPKVWNFVYVFFLPTLTHVNAIIRGTKHSTKVEISNFVSDLSFDTHVFFKVSNSYFNIINCGILRTIKHISLIEGDKTSMISIVTFEGEERGYAVCGFEPIYRN